MRRTVAKINVCNIPWRRTLSDNQFRGVEALPSCLPTISNSQAPLNPISARGATVRATLKHHVSTLPPQLHSEGASRHYINPEILSIAREHIRPVIMASFQRAVIAFLLILSVTFVFLAQNVEATKGPKITHKVCTPDDQVRGDEC
jgi:hypothetical protein